MPWLLLFAASAWAQPARDRYLIANYFGPGVAEHAYRLEMTPEVLKRLTKEVLFCQVLLGEKQLGFSIDGRGRGPAYFSIGAALGAPASRLSFSDSRQAARRAEDIFLSSRGTLPGGVFYIGVYNGELTSLGKSVQSLPDFPFAKQPAEGTLGCEYHEP